MIAVSAQNEPPDFHQKVRQPGQAFLITNPRPTSKDWRQHDYWRRAHHDLRIAYNAICAYSSSFTAPPDPNQADTASIDHFVPRAISPYQAYEWDNFRYCRERLNNRKGDHTDVLDPFTLSTGWFNLNFLTFLLAPDPSLPKVDRDAVCATIKRLQLNADNDYVNERASVVTGYCAGSATFDQIADLFPFIASEMLRQDFDANFLPLWRRWQSPQ